MFAEKLGVNCQIAMAGMGTATSELVELLGLEPHKVVILSVVREDLVDEVMNCLEDKFDTIRKGKGISFMENQAGWHGVAPNDAQYEAAMAELEKAGEALCQK